MRRGIPCCVATVACSDDADSAAPREAVVDDADAGAGSEHAAAGAVRRAQQAIMCILRISCGTLAPMLVTSGVVDVVTQVVTARRDLLAISSSLRARRADSSVALRRSRYRSPDESPQNPVSSGDLHQLRKC